MTGMSYIYGESGSPAKVGGIILKYYLCVLKDTIIFVVNVKSRLFLIEQPAFCVLLSYFLFLPVPVILPVAHSFKHLALEMFLGILYIQDFACRQYFKI